MPKPDLSLWTNPNPPSNEPDNIEELTNDPILGGGNGGPPVDSHTRDYIDGRINTANAQNDAKFEKVISRLDSMPSKWTIWGAAGTFFLGGLAILAFAGDRFDGGMSASTDGAVAKQLIEQQSSDIQKLIDSQSIENQKMIDALADHHEGQKGFEVPK